MDRDARPTAGSPTHADPTAAAAAGAGPGAPRAAAADDTEAAYRRGIADAAELLRSWDGPVVVIAHVDPDGDALGSVLALGRALRRLGKDVVMPLEPPRFLAFVARDGELSQPLGRLPEGALLVVLDSDPGRATGAPTEGAATVLNLDHHGTNAGTSDLSVVAPQKAATALMVKDAIDALGLEWDVELATPCLLGIVSDTGTFRFGNTSKEVLYAAGDLIDVGVPYVELIDRMRWRHRDHYTMLAMVMATVRFDLGGLMVSLRQTAEMRARLGQSEDDSSDFVNVVRDAEGTKVAVFLREVDDDVKVSVRSRDGVSAQSICRALGGGGHVSAAGARLRGTSIDEAFDRTLAATREELERSDVILPD